MLTLAQINKAINDKVKSALVDTPFSDVPLMADDVSEPAERPYIKIMQDGSVNGLFNGQCREKTLTFRIYFFAENVNKYAIDNMKMQDVLENALLAGFYVDEAYIPIESMTTDTVDTVLISSLDIYLVELLPDTYTGTDTNETMEELKYKGVTK